MLHITFMTHSEILAPRYTPWPKPQLCRDALRHVADETWRFAPRRMSLEKSHRFGRGGSFLPWNISRISFIISRFVKDFVE